MGAPLRFFLGSLIALSVTTGCSVTAKIDDPRQIWCDHNQPRRDATADTPRAELDDINSHNAKGALWCGWVP
jgi:hypothetical protein